MAITLPTIGEAGSTWPSKLNTFLEVSLDNPNGTLKVAQVTNALATATGAFHSADIVVWNAAIINGTTNTFTDLDLSAVATGIIGANVALVILQVTSDTAAYISVKPKGTLGGTGAYHTNGQYPMGIGNAYIGINFFAYIASTTSGAGVVQLSSPSTTAKFTIKLIGYIR